MGLRAPRPDVSCHLLLAHGSSAMSDPEVEDEDLQGMIGGVPRGMYIKLQQAQKNRNAADEVRREREELMALKQQRYEEQAERINRLRAKREQRHTTAADQHRSHVDSVAAEVRAQVREAEAQRKVKDQEHWRQARVRVEAANNLDGKLDAAEAKQDEMEREEQRELRQQRLASLEARRAKDNETKAFLNAKVRNIHKSAADGKAKFKEDKQAQVRDAKEAIGQWRGAKNANQQAHLDDARERARRRAAEKAEARERNDARMAQRRQNAREEKANNAVATKALADEVSRNRKNRNKIMARRYVPTEEVETLEASDTFRKLYGLPDADGKIKSVARALPPSPPKEKK